MYGITWHENHVLHKYGVSWCVSPYFQFISFLSLLPEVVGQSLEYRKVNMEIDRYTVDRTLLEQEDLEYIENFFDEEDSTETENMLGLLMLSLRLIDCGLYSCVGSEQLESVKAGHEVLKEAMSMLDNELLKKLDAMVVAELEKRCKEM